MEDVANVSIRKARENLCKWDDLTDPIAPISDENQESVVELLPAATSRPYSSELYARPANSIPLAHETRSDTSLKVQSSSSIASISEFLNWYDDAEEKHAHKIKGDLLLPSAVKAENPSNCTLGTKSAIADYIGQLNGHREESQALLHQLNAALHHLDELHSQYTSVSTRTTALHTDCEHLLAEQTSLSNTAEDIQTKLWYFTQVESISQKLTSPAFTVTSEGFIPLLAKIDQCIAYMRNNPKYRESSIYLVRYMHCLSRALGLIRIYVTKSLEAATKQVLPKPGESQPNSDNASVLYYSKFRTNAPRIKALMKEIEDRLVDQRDLTLAETSSEQRYSVSSIHSQATSEKISSERRSLSSLYQVSSSDALHQVEYRNLLLDCHQCYFMQRRQLLGPCVTDAVAQLLAKYRKDHCTLVRSGCSFLVHVCEDEHMLFQQFFSLPTTELDNFLEGLCIALYDGLRPLIIHIDHLETLSELCSILRRGMIEEHLQSNPQQLSALRSVVTRMLEDAQERLVYRAHVYITTDIAGFTPSPGDVAYPSKLELMEQIAKEINDSARRASLAQAGSFSDAASVVSLGSESGMAGVRGERFSRVGSSPADLHGMWYPTLRRTLMCLSKLYRCVDKTIFQGVSLEAVAACVQSLAVAAAAITSTSSATHAALFQIKHLLILREQLAPFQVESSIRETTLDWSKLKDAAYGLVQHRGNLFSLSSNNALLQFIVDGTPHVLELRMDSKQDVDQELKRVCERLIHTSTETLVGRLTAFIAKLQLITNMNSREKNIKPILLKNQPFATPEKVNELVSEVCRDIRSKLPKLQRDLHLYLANRDTEFILLKPVRVNVASSFGRLQKILSEEYSADDILIANCPSVDEINIMMNALLENRDEIKESSSRAGSVSQQKRTSTPVHGNEGETNLSRDESTLQEQSSPATVIAVSNGVADIGVNGQYPEVSSTQQASSTAELTSGLNGT